MSISVIGAGIGRTGTTTLRSALEQLGFVKCYHMEELAKYPSHSTMWIDAAEGRRVNWDALFDGYQAAVDLPTYAFYAELMTYYPEAKVILTLREPEEWYESASQTIFRLPPKSIMPLLRVASVVSSQVKTLVRIEPVARRVGYEYFFEDDVSKEHAIEVFERHNEAVQNTVPPERLLVYQVDQGWEPLCEFLAVPVPELPFPHMNTRDEFARRSTPAADASVQS